MIGTFGDSCPARLALEVAKHVDAHRFGAPLRLSDEHCLRIVGGEDVQLVVAIPPAAGTTPGSTAEATLEDQAAGRLPSNTMSCA